MQDGKPLLEIIDLHVQFSVYGGRLNVLDGVDFVMYPGEKVGLVGETGCGKTTTMKAILRVLPMPPAVIPQGEIYFEGRNILGMSTDDIMSVRGRGISMIFQDPTAALNPVFSIGEQIEAVIKYSASPDRAYTKQEIHQRAIDALKEVALADPERLLRSYPVQLSGGMRQRVCIGMALSTNPKLLIADEPGTSLDVTIQDQVLRLLRNLVEEKNTSVILITHTLGIVRETTRPGLRDVRGQDGGSGFNRETICPALASLHPGADQHRPAADWRRHCQRDSRTHPRLSQPAGGCRFHPRCPHVMEVCRKEKPPAFQVDAQHSVACFLYRKDDTA